MSVLLLRVDEMQRLFGEELFIARNKEIYEQHCSEIENSETERNRLEIRDSQWTKQKKLSKQFERT